MRPVARPTRMLVRPAEAQSHQQATARGHVHHTNTRRDNGSIPIGRRAEVPHTYTVPVVRERPPRGVPLLAG